MSYQYRDYPYGMDANQQGIFGSLQGNFKSLGFCIRSEPLEGREQEWLDSLMEKLDRIEAALKDVNKFYRTRGKSKAALYYLHNKPSFDPGFGLDQSAQQKAASAEYDRALKAAAARYDAADKTERLDVFVSKIARLVRDGENGFEADLTDSAATLDNLITEARMLSSPNSTEKVDG